MKVVGEKCMVCGAWGDCTWIAAPILRLCDGCYFDKFGTGPPA